MGEDCMLGRQCPCWIEGEEEGVYQVREDDVSEALEAARESIEKVLNHSIQPLEDRLILKDDKSILAELSHLKDLKRKLLEVVR